MFEARVTSECIASFPFRTIKLFLLNNSNIALQDERFQMIFKLHEALLYFCIFPNSNH